MPPAAEGGLDVGHGQRELGAGVAGVQQGAGLVDGSLAGDGEELAGEGAELGLVVAEAPHSRCWG